MQIKTRRIAYTPSDNWMKEECAETTENHGQANRRYAFRVSLTFFKKNCVIFRNDILVL